MSRSRVELVKDLMIFLNCSIEVLIVNKTFVIIEINETFGIIGISDVVENVEESLFENFGYEKDFV